jgi:argininosuccinate synthase
VTPPIVLGHAGRPDVARLIRSLAAGEGREVVTLTLDFGQRDDFRAIRDRALAGGAARALVLDVREAFARECILPALWAGAWAPSGGDADERPATALGHALIGKMLADVAAIEGADVVAHGGTGHARARLDAAIAACGPHLRVVAVREPAAPGQRAPLDLVKGDGHPAGPGPVPQAEAASVEIRFERGLPTALFDIPMPLHELVECVATIGGREDAGAAILREAYRSLEAAVVPPGRADDQRERAMAYAALMRDGCWFGNRRAALDASSAEVFEVMTGIVRVAVRHEAPPAATVASLPETVAVRS